MKAKRSTLYTLRSYTDAFRYLCRFTDYERMAKIHYNQTAYNLKRMRWLLDAIGNPQNKLRCIHIAGTKGKGSTAMMTAQILASAGYCVGLYTSPHLTDLRERIQIWNQTKEIISKNDFTYLMNYIVKTIVSFKTQDARRKTHNTTLPTFFELMTALGFLYFARKKTDFAVIEVGLGGRLDATNLITPLVSVITRIDFDHTDKLGNTIKRIAYEKAGIIKRGIPVVTFRQKSAADKVIKHEANIKNAELSVAEMTESEKLKAKNFLRVLGAHQTENCSLALGVIKVLNRGNYTDINTAMIKSALRELQLPARLELVQSNNPLNPPLLKGEQKGVVIIDSAHNPLSIKATAETIKKMKYRNLILILAISRDKEITKMLNTIIPIANIVILTKTNHPRLLQPEEFLKYLPSSPFCHSCPAIQRDKLQLASLSFWGDPTGRRSGQAPPPRKRGNPRYMDSRFHGNDTKRGFFNSPILFEPDHKKALEMAQRLAGKEDLILITGSFYLAGPLRDFLLGSRPVRGEMKRLFSPARPG